MLAHRASSSARNNTARPISSSSRRHRTPAVQVSAMKIAVTGAGGRTGKLVVKRLLEAQDADAASVSSVAATVRSGDAAGRLKSDLPELAAAHNAVHVVDVAKLGREAQAGASPPQDKELAAALEGADALIIATSGVPQIKKRSLVWVMVAKLIGKQGVRPSFRWKSGETPEVLDWWGQKAQIDAAIAAGVKRVVIVSSAGGTDPENMLNKLGDGNILQWKRKAEQYLKAKAEEGKLTYTVLHPGGLVDTPALQRPLLFGVDDVILKRKKRSIPRDDVARVCLAAAGALGGGGVGGAVAGAFKNKSLDLICEQPDEDGGEDDAAKAAAAKAAKAQDLATLASAVGVYDYTKNDCSSFA